MLKMGSIHNRDGFGIFNERGEIFKVAEKFSYKYIKEIMSRFKGSKFVVAHNRMATEGKIDISNTHPFHVGNFLFVHNGYILNHAELKLKYRVSADNTVDSIVLGYALNSHYQKEKEIVKAIRKTTKEIAGLFAIFIYNTERKELYFIKHNAEFTFATIKNFPKKTILGSTDKENIWDLYLKRRNGVIVTDYESIRTAKPKDRVIYRISEAGITEAGIFTVNRDYDLVFCYNKSYYKWHDELDYEPLCYFCWREYETGLYFLENDDGEFDFMCPKCPEKFREKCLEGEIIEMEE